MSAPADMAYPRFYHIGVPRTGTTTLQRVLRADERIHIFRSRFFNTPAWYLERPDFEIDPHRVNVLSSETIVRKYDNRLKFSASIDHIRQVAPDAQILLTIREQRSWLISRYQYGVGRQRLSKDFATWLRTPDGGDFISVGHYATLIRYLDQVFPPENIHVLMFENLKDRYEDYFRQVYRILGLDFRSPPVMTANARPCDERLRVRRFLNRFFSESRGEVTPGKLRSALSDYIERAMIKGLRLSGRGRGPALRWGEDKFFQTLERDFRESNRALIQRTGLPLEEAGYLV